MPNRELDMNIKSKLLRCSEKNKMDKIMDRNCPHGIPLEKFDDREIHGLPWLYLSFEMPNFFIRSLKVLGLMSSN